MGDAMGETDHMIVTGSARLICQEWDHVVFERSKPSHKSLVSQICDDLTG